jgi:integrase
MATPKLRSVTLHGIEYYPVDLPAGFDGGAKRSKRYCRSRSQVADLKARIKQWKLNRKYRPDTVEITETDKGWVAFLHNEIGHDLSDLPRIVRHWKETGKAIIARVTVRHSVDEFLKYRETQVAAKTLTDDRYRLGKFKVRFGDWQLSEMIPSNFREFMDEREDDTSKRNDYKILSPWIKWCIEKRWIVLNPLAEIKRPKVKNKTPATYSIEAFKALIAKAGQETLAFIAIGGLAGLRTAEMLQEREADEVIKWSDLDFKEARITVRAEVSKTAQRRYVPMCPALVKWLEPLRRDTGKVVSYSQSTFRNYMTALFTVTGVGPIDNGLRHSFASYWLAKNGKKGVGELALIMGNSEAIAKKHYIEVLKPEDGRKWFGIAPKAENSDDR